MKILRMSPSVAAAWRDNVPQLVDNSGMVIRRLRVDEDKVVSAVIRKAREKRQTVGPVDLTVAQGEKPLSIKVEVTHTGHGHNEFWVEAYVDGLRRVSGRDVLCARVLAEYGECQLRRANGTVACVIRDPSKDRPTYKDSLKSAPKPDNCDCRIWGSPHPGTHYATCPWNKLAPPDEQASTGPTDAELAMLPPIPLPSLSRPSSEIVTSVKVDTQRLVKEQNPLDPPATCREKCYDWATPNGTSVEDGQHNPMCPQAHRWAIKTSTEEPFSLVDLHSGARVRAASAEERGQAEIAVRKGGAPLVHINDVPYIVMSDAEIAKSEETA